jgi:hypothetical protein
MSLRSAFFCGRAMRLVGRLEAFGGFSSEGLPGSPKKI